MSGVAPSAVAEELAGRFRAALRCPEDGGQLGEADRLLLCESCGARYPIDASGTYVLLASRDRDSQERAFYDAPAEARHGRDATAMPAELSDPVHRFLRRVDPAALVLEIGSGRGAFDGIRPGLIQLDLSGGALAGLSGMRVQASAQSLPFADQSLDAIFTVAALEHVPDPGRALAEIDRVLRPGGTALVYPAWYVRPWAAKALHQRSFGELGFPDRLRKLTIPLRNRREYQFATRLPRRIAAELGIGLGRRQPFRFRALTPNLERYLTSDSDAFASMDPHAAAAFFVSRGYRDFNRSSGAARLAYAYEPVVVEKPNTLPLVTAASERAAVTSAADRVEQFSPAEEFNYDERYNLPIHWILDPFSRTGIDYFDYVEQVVRLVAQHRPRRVLDAGCGDGYVSDRLSRRGAEVIGVDASASAIGFARVLVPGAQFLEADLRSLRPDQIGGEVDAVTLIEVLEHIPVADQIDVLRSLRAVMKPGAEIYVTLPSVDLPLIPWHYKHYTADDAASLMDAAGFELEHLSSQFRLTPLSRALFVRARWWRLIENRLYDIRVARRLLAGWFARRYSTAPAGKAAGRLICRARAV